MEESKRIAVCLDNYKNEDDMWKDISEISKILIRQDYEVLIRHEDCGVHIIEYAHDPNRDNWGCDRYMLVTEDEQYDIESRRMSSEEDDLMNTETEEEE